MTTGWKAARDSRRAGKKQDLKRNPPTANISKRRRTSVKDSNSALRMKGLLPS